jgi:hypothetical protein
MLIKSFCEHGNESLGFIKREAFDSSILFSSYGSAPGVELRTG